MEASDLTGRNESLAKTAAMLAGAALLTMVVLAALDHDGAAWLLQGVFGLAAVVTGYRAGGASPKNRLAFGALLVGAILLLMFLGFIVAGD
jgi:hypothetical protein